MSAAGRADVNISWTVDGPDVRSGETVQQLGVKAPYEATHYYLWCFTP